MKNIFLLVVIFIFSFNILLSQCFCSSSGTNSQMASITPSTLNTWTAVGTNFYAGDYLKIKICPGSTYQFTNCNAVTGGTLSSLGQYGTSYDGRFDLYDENWNYISCNSSSGNSSCPNACDLSYTVPSSATYQYLYLAVFNEASGTCGNSYVSTRYSKIGYKVSGSVTCCTNWSTSGNEYTDYIGDSGFVYVYATGTCTYTISNTSSCPSNFSLTPINGGVTWSIAKSCTAPIKSCTINVQSNGVTKTSFSLNQSGYSNQTTTPNITAYPTTVCNGQPALLTINNFDTDFNYTWSTGGSTDQIIVSNPATYSATCTDQCGSQKSGTITINQKPNPSNPTLSSFYSPCPNSHTSISVDNFDIENDYLWTPSPNSNYGDSVVFSIGTNPLTVTAKARDKNCSSLMSGITSFTVNPTPYPNPPIIYPPLSPCANDSTQIFIQNYNPVEYNYELKKNSFPNPIYIDSTGKAIVQIGTNPDTFTCRVQELNCYLWSSYKTEIISPLTSSFTVKITRKDSTKTLCISNTSIVDTLYGQTIPACTGCDFKWTKDGVTQSISKNLPTKASGVYKLEVTSCAVTKSETISVLSMDNPLIPKIKSTPDSILCSNSSSILSILNQSDYDSSYTYLWNSNTTAKKDTVSGVGIFYVKVTNKCGSFKTSSNFLIPVKPSFISNPSFSPSKLSVCSPNTQKLNLIPSNLCSGCNYEWLCSNCNGNIGNLITITDTGLVKIKTKNYCGDSLYTQIYIDNKPIANISAQDTNVCKGDSVLLTATSGTSYIWNTGATTQQIYATLPLSIYSVNVTNPANCSGVASATKNLNQKRELIADAGRDTSVLKGQTITLGGNPTASNGNSTYFYNWNGNVSNAIIPNPTAVINNSFDYCVTVSDGINCPAKKCMKANMITGCESLVLNKYSMEINREGKLDTLKVTAPNNCIWTATNSNSTMMSIQSGNIGTGSEPLIQIFINGCGSSNTDREGEITVESKKYTIKQKCKCATYKAYDTIQGCFIYAKELPQPVEYILYKGTDLIIRTTNRIIEAKGNGSYLLEILKDGCKSISYFSIENCISSGIKNSISNSKIDIYPNPANSSITISATKLKSNEISLHIFDLQGKKISTRIVSVINREISQVIDVSILPKGQYQIVIESDSETRTAIFQIEH